MTEAEWLESTDLKEMLQFLSDKASNRKFRLFACACVRRVWHLLADERSRQTVLVAEKFSDGLATKEQLMAAAAEAKAAAEEQARLIAGKTPPRLSTNREAAMAASEAKAAAINAHWAASWTAVGAGQVGAWAAAKNTERTGQPALLREIMGNPFQKPVVPERWSPTITMFAGELYSDHRGQFTLHKMLLKGGLAELAEHFREPEQSHPKGCWALDLILHRQ